MNGFVSESVENNLWRKEKMQVNKILLQHVKLSYKTILTLSQTSPGFYVSAVQVF